MKKFFKCLFLVFIIYFLYSIDSLAWSMDSYDIEYSSGTLVFDFEITSKVSGYSGNFETTIQDLTATTDTLGITQKYFAIIFPSSFKNSNPYVQGDDLYASENYFYLGVLQSDSPLIFESITNSDNIVTVGKCTNHINYSGIKIGFKPVRSFNVTTSTSISSAAASTSYNYSGELLFTTNKITDTSGNSYSPIKPPSFFTTLEEFNTGQFGVILINNNGNSTADDMDITYNLVITNESSGYLKTYSLYPNFLSNKYYMSSQDMFSIPQSSLGFNFQNGDVITYEIIEYSPDGSVVESITSTISDLTADIIENNYKDTIIDKESQQAENSNNILKNIISLVNYINPFSDDFFGKKLVDFIIEGLKTLFIPSDDFFSIYWDNWNIWLSDKLGFLYYPIDLTISVLNSFLDVDFENPHIYIPQVIEPTTNKVLIEENTFYFSEITTNEVFSNMHNLYFLFVRFTYIYFLVKLIDKKYKKLIGDTVISE